MKKRMLIMLIVVGLVFGGVFGFEAFKNVMIGKFIAKMKNPTETVSTTKAETSAWRETLESVATLRAHRSAELSPQVAGIVDGIHFQSGDTVKKGDLLVTLNADDDLAKLQSLKATESLAQTTYDRDVKQYSAKAIARQALDSDEATLKQAKANVAQQQAAVNYKFIRAPFSGRLGIRQVDLGQYLNPGTGIVTLQALDPVYADFFLPQQSLSTIKIGQQVTATTDAFPGAKFEGSITAINPTVDTATRNVQVRAELKNPDGKLLTGMYATVDVVTGAPQDYVTVPQTAITYNPYGDTVYLVEPAKDGKDENLKVRQQFVTVGATRGDQIQILKGVEAGDTVVTAGQLKLHNGTPVEVDNAITPSDDAHPTPQEQ